jgi:hypothetical protein
MAKQTRNETSVVVAREPVQRRELAKRLLDGARQYQRLAVGFQTQIRANRPMVCPPLESALANCLNWAATMRESARLIVKDAS